MSSTGGDSQNTEKSSEMKSNSSNLTDLNSPSKMLSTSSSGGYTTPVKAVMDSTSSTSGYTTPIKGSFTPSSRSQASGSGFRSPSFSSPSSKGQGEDLVGYLVTVGPIQKSRKKRRNGFSSAKKLCFLMTNLQVIDYFGVYLSTVFDSAFSTSVEEIVPSWPADFDSMVTKLETKTILSAEINSVAISTSAFCPACKHDIDGEFLECNPCNRTFKSRKCKFHLSGTIEVEGIEDGAACTVEVNVDSANIDQMFGEGTVRRYGRNIKELKHRLLQQENMEITYVPETKKITMITIEQSIPEKMKKDNDDNG